MWGISSIDTLKKLSMATAGSAFFSLGTVGIAQAATLTSAPLGLTGETSGFSVNDEQFLGWRFQLDSASQVTAVGGHIGAVGNIFGAIVAINDPNALPQGNPFLPGEVLASTTFNPGFISSDARTPLSVTLGPGNYELIFGSGLFGATGSGFMPSNNSDFLGSTYFYYSARNSGGTWVDGGISNTRFVVEANAIPEPSSAVGTLAFSALGAGCLLQRKLKNKN